MSASYHSIITHSLTDIEKAMVNRAVIKASAPSTDSALLGAVRLLELLKKAGLVIPAEIADAVANPITTIDQWTVGVDGSKTVVVGSIKDDAHGRFADGEVIHTSRITGDRRQLREGAIIETRNSRYRLGTRSKTIPKTHQAVTARSGYELLAPRA